MATFLQRQWRRAKKAGGKMVDAAVDIGLPSAGAYIGGALGSLCGPLAGACVPAGYAIGAYAGTQLAKPAKRTVKRSAAKAEEWLEWKGEGPRPERPEDLPTELGAGAYGAGSVMGTYEDAETVDWGNLVLVAAAVGAATFAAFELRRHIGG